MKNQLTRILFSILAFSISNFALSADFDIPSLSRCANDMVASNTNDTKTYNIFSDFYYEFEDKRDYAAMALSKMTEQFSAENSACRSFTQPMNRETIQCEKFAGSDVCIVPSDAGEFIVVKDFVDSTNIILTHYDKDYKKFPAIDSINDQESLWLPMPELCYDTLLDGLWDSQSYQVDAKPYLRFGDFRYIMARSNRDLLKNLSANNASCAYQTTNHLASTMHCLKRNKKPSICSVSTTGGGYFIYVTDEDNSVHMIFNRWD